MQCPSHDWDRHCVDQDRQAVEAWKQQCKPTNGLYSKFVVEKTEYTETKLDDEAGGGIEVSVSTQPLDVGSFVLVPFRDDGTVRDKAAIAALCAYRDACEIPAVKDAIADWLANPTKYDWLNQPCQP